MALLLACAAVHGVDLDVANPWFCLLNIFAAGSVFGLNLVRYLDARREDGVPSPSVPVVP